MDMVGVEGERLGGRGRETERKEVHEKEGWGDVNVEERSMRADLLRRKDGEKNKCEEEEG